MKALVHRRYGPPQDVLRLEDADPPVAGEGEVVVRVRAASVNPVDWHLVRGEPALLRLITGVRRPRSPFAGSDAAGVVEAVGPGVTGLAPGDEVFGTAAGSLAELARAKAERLARKPERLTFAQAAVLPIAACTALQALRDHGRLAPGQRVLILGASGGVGVFAVQLAKELGAEVTGVCSGANVDLVRSRGADHVVDYTRERPEGTFDVVLQIAGSRPLSELRGLLAPRGTLVVVGGGVGREGAGGRLGPVLRLVQGRLLSRKRGKRISTFITKVNRADLETVGALVTPTIERSYPLADAASALADIEGGHVRGKIAIEI